MVCNVCEVAALETNLNSSQRKVERWRWRKLREEIERQTYCLSRLCRWLFRRALSRMENEKIEEPSPILHFHPCRLAVVLRTDKLGSEWQIVLKRPSNLRVFLSRLSRIIYIVQQKLFPSKTLQLMLLLVPKAWSRADKSIYWKGSCARPIRAFIQGDPCGCELFVDVELGIAPENLGLKNVLKRPVSWCRQKTNFKNAIPAWWMYTSLFQDIISNKHKLVHSHKDHPVEPSGLSL